MTLLTQLIKSFPFTVWREYHRSDSEIKYRCNNKTVFSMNKTEYFLNQMVPLFNRSYELYRYFYLTKNEIILEIYKKYLLI